MNKIFKSFIETWKTAYEMLKYNFKKMIRKMVCKCGDK
jgi:hypothetical protein